MPRADGKYPASGSVPRGGARASGQYTGSAGQYPRAIGHLQRHGHGGVRPALSPASGRQRIRSHGVRGAPPACVPGGRRSAFGDAASIPSWAKLPVRPLPDPYPFVRLGLRCG